MTKLPISPYLPVSRLSAIFKDTTNSYKLYWFYAILQIIKDDKQIISINEVTARMIASTWYSVNYFKISLGKQDKLRQAVAKIKEDTILKDDDKESVVIAEILSNLDNSPALKNICKSFQRYVPFLLLSPFFKTELRGTDGSRRNKAIVQLAEESFRNLSKPPSLYRFTNDKKIEINSYWFDYIKTNIKILEGFCLWNLTRYLQRKNPHIPNIGGKIFAPPENRNLNTARKFWDLVFKQQNIQCIFTKQPVNAASYSIDHFVPWSFVTHDMLWNLAPISKEVNSSKSNNIPSLIAYFEGFAHLQYSAFHIIYDLRKNRLMEDYCILFDSREEEIADFSQDVFSKKLRNHIAPLSQIAENSGFLGEWVYK